MRIFARCVAFIAVLALGVSSGAFAQDQPAAGSPPPGAAAQTQQAPDQNAAPAQTQPAPEQNAAPAQDNAMPPPPIDARRGPNPQRQAKMLAKKLGLTPDQQADVELILANRKQRMQHARNDVTLAPRDKRTVTREINRDSVKRINALLNPEQRARYKQLRQQERAKRMEQREQRSMTPPPAPGNPQ